MMKKLGVFVCFGLLFGLTQTSSAISLPTLFDLANRADVTEGSFDAQVTMERENILAGFIFDGYGRDSEMVVYNDEAEFQFETEFASEIERDNWAQL